MSATYIGQLFPNAPYKVGVAHGLGVYHVSAHSFDEALTHYFLMEFSSRRNFQREELTFGSQEWVIPPSAWDALLVYGRRQDWILIDFVEDEGFWGNINRYHAMPTHITICTPQGDQECLPDESWLTTWVQLWEHYEWNIEALSSASRSLTIQDLDSLSDKMSDPGFTLFLPVQDLKAHLDSYVTAPSFQEVSFF